MAPLIRESDGSSFDSMDIDDISVSSAMSLSSIMACDKTASDQRTAASTTTRKNVHFDEDIQVHYVLNRLDYTAFEVCDCYYDRVELRDIKNRTKGEAKQLEFGLLEESKDVSVRGLEGRTPEGLTRKRKNRADAYNAVLDEVDRQEEIGYSDDDYLADVYFRHSEQSRTAAEMIGLRDARLAKEILMEEEYALKTDENLFQTRAVLACLPPNVQTLASSAA